MKRFIPCSALAVLCGTLSTPLLAQSTTAKPAVAATSANQATTDGQRNEQRSNATIAKLGERVELTSEQKTSIKSTLNEDRAAITEAWAKYSADQVKMVRLEAQMVAAMDDIL